MGWGKTGSEGDRRVRSARQHHIRVTFWCGGCHQKLQEHVISTPAERMTRYIYLTRSIVGLGVRVV